MFCNNCGKQISEGVAFCGKCGRQITSQENKTNSVNEKPIYSPEELKQVHSYLILIEQAKKTANIEMFKGIAWAALGLLITFITYAMASDGGTYSVFWGLGIYGAYIFFRGLYWRISPKNLLKKALETTPDNPEENNK